MPSHRRFIYASSPPYVISFQEMREKLRRHHYHPTQFSFTWYEQTKLDSGCSNPPLSVSSVHYRDRRCYKRCSVAHVSFISSFPAALYSNFNLLTPPVTKSGSFRLSQRFFQHPSNFWLPLEVVNVPHLCMAKWRRLRSLRDRIRQVVLTFEVFIEIVSEVPVFTKRLLSNHKRQASP